MAKRNKKQTRRLRNLVMLCTMCAIVLTVSTYAWFIGMKTVNVSTFEIDIATTEGLFLSMDGVNWSYKLDARNAAAYDGNSNTWATTGLIPMSTVGDMDSNSSRMKLFEKASLTASTGGYRLLTSRVQNFVTVPDDVTAPDDSGFYQGKGYVAFDLFIKNLSGEAYYPTNEPKNEEAIYLTTNSKVDVAEGGVRETGIENSVRVAFAQIGRVKADTTTQSTITGIDCTGSKDAQGNTIVTGICRSAQIWEPNDKDHVQNAINWYTTSCKKRKETGTDVNSKDSYDTSASCGTVVDGTPNKTYAISKEIVITDNVDIYDGTAYNGYKANEVSYDVYSKADDKSLYTLVDFDYFTDSEKIETGTARKPFMTLAPNSITKVRVYVYIEGQDVDNYDFASLGKKIAINFGFTKERFIETDIDYYGPSTDITPTQGDEVVTPEA